MSKYWPCITNKCHVVNKLFHNFEARLWKYYNVTMNSPHFICSFQSWHNVGATSWYRRQEDFVNFALYLYCIDVAITTSMISSEGMFYRTFMQRWHKVVVWRLIISVVKTLWINVRDVNIASNLSIQH